MSEHDSQKVYIIQHELGLYKIGIAENPEKRVRQLQVGSPFELKLRQTENPTNARRVEQHLHEKLRKFHFRGEWFDLPEEQLPLTIPTHVSKAGVPNKDVGVVTDRDIDTEWIQTFRRTVTAFKDGPKHASRALSHLQQEWRDYLDDDDDDRPDLDTPTIHEAMGEAEPGEVLCARCGYSYDHNENTCPMCGSDAYAEPDEGRW